MNTTEEALRIALKNYGDDVIDRIEETRDKAIAAIHAAGKRRSLPSVGTAKPLGPKEIAALLGMSRMRFAEQVARGKLVDVALAAKITGLPKHRLADQREPRDSPAIIEDLGCNRQRFSLYALLSWKASVNKENSDYLMSLPAASSFIKEGAIYGVYELATLLCLSTTTVLKFRYNSQSIFFEMGHNRFDVLEVAEKIIGQV